MRRAQAIVVAAGSALAQRLSYMQEMDAGAGWTPGTYRAALTYAPAPGDATSGAGTTVYSAEFPIQ